MPPQQSGSRDVALLSRIEDAGLNASAPSQQRWLDGWLLRFSPGKAKRARCINAVATGRLPVADKLSLSMPVFAAAGLPLLVRITPFTLPSALDAMLEKEGLQRFDDTQVMTLDGLDGLAAPALPPGVTLRGVGLEAFAQHVGGLRGSTLSQQQAHGRRLVDSPVPFAAVEMRRDGELLACGQMALEADLVGLYDVYTAESERGRGLSGLLCRHLLVQAHAHGARLAYLQVEGGNHAARRVYQRLGFVDAYSYHYRAHDPATA